MVTIVTADVHSVQLLFNFMWHPGWSQNAEQAVWNSSCQNKSPQRQYLLVYGKCSFRDCADCQSKCQEITHCVLPAMARVKLHLEMTFLLVRNQVWVDAVQLVPLPQFSVLEITAGQDISVEGCSWVFQTVHVSKCLKMSWWFSGRGDTSPSLLKGCAIADVCFGSYSTSWELTLTKKLLAGINTVLTLLKLGT